MAEQCRTCGERGMEGLSLLEPENAPLLQFIIIHLQNKLAGGSFFVCHACVVEIQHWRNFLTRFQTSQTHFQQVLATSDSPQQTTDVSLETKLAKCQVLVTKLLQCDSCSFYTNNKTQLESHMQTHLKATNTADATGSRRPTANEDDSISRRYGRIPLHRKKCAQCNINFVYPEMLVWHTKFCHGPEATVRIVNIGKQHHYQCSFCKTMHSNHYLINRHLRDHHGISKNLPFHCNNCEKQFVRNVELQAHQFKCNNGRHVRRVRALDYKCGECGIKYGDPEMLSLHSELCHGNNAVVKIIKIGNSKKYNFQCIFCQTIYKTLNLIFRHFRMQHNLENSPFHCNYCEKRFVTNYTLKKHELKCNNKKAVDCTTKYDVQLNPQIKTYKQISGSVKCKLNNVDFNSDIELKKSCCKISFEEGEEKMF